MSDHDDGLDVYVGRGTVPDGVIEAVSAATGRPCGLVLPPPSRERVDGFFGDIADLIKRAGGEP